ncbi:MAG: CDGSH iron-sulfur domain-containing protein [Balneolaceae bacterium]|nr:CDGSH iron-sulfur domain-containing protein [Balneolaceae bacterium]
MEEKIHRYESNNIEIQYDLNRCIHARECVKGLRAVFNPEKRPWIQPDNATIEEIVDVVERCPTGALHYRLKTKNKKEQPPDKNTINVVPDGPVYFRGDIEVQDHENNVVLTDTRFALCRCGLSANKPACDNTHVNSEFEASAAINAESLKEKEKNDTPDKLVIKLMKNGPALLDGSYEIYSEVSEPQQCSKNIALCRCGASDNKPFCDGSHKEIGFES